ncbi:eukaryotic initiation factor 4g [Fadolivirus algeromassiliense]|jgi:translation initiation factor 4G|uniref:Eukaryotic initiation factor 4g n=1 Tax=Fadolivirus FV1/VV64 TaxID=3070911 RepID=A0A7D3V5F2_9VIRU|nr:eukaryotic initiation factor 4g [Fadolivirus algeromassiliense]QKF93752.1 eukaryotic initiation factor 4g [Fadolivirus FV1/VV64]
MTTTLPPQISIDEFMRFKLPNQEMLPELVEYYNTNKHRFLKTGNTGNWRKFDQKAENWLVANKFKQNDDEKLYSQFRSILNKLSDSNFNSLADELTKLEIGKSEHLAKLAEFIFNKAIIETKFASMYAKLSKELSGYSVKENDKQVFFRELLISRCQTMFNECSSYEPSVPNKTLITKEIAVGCMVFIGELYNMDLLTTKIINSCFLLLIVKINQNKPFIIDSICALMKTVGTVFSKKANAESKVVFEKLEAFITNKEKTQLCNKDKFALMDLFDLKKTNNW